ncbi:hypothetical protein [Acinetobacter baumannii]|uniref:hypothetical protein n=1 Tax=Acinetobacter baumannii TaxID=470 RepID=UPI0022EAF60F|nr:hypothetical protein [Acinetobacter baumannii]MDA3477384.1 hypothetical protein [Acinetobacter baumannii]
MSKNVIAFSISVSVILLAILIWCVFGILFKYWGDVTATKDSLSTISGIFGGLTTLGAAIIAAHLFNDWREQEKAIFVRSVAYEVTDLMGQLIDLMQGYPDFEDYNVFKIKLLHTRITVKLSILNRQIKDSNMKIVNKNFGYFIREYMDIIKLKNSEIIDHKIMKECISELIQSYSADFGYLAKLTDIHNIKN